MAQQGFEYEKNAAKYLAEHKLVKPGYKPAGAGHARADLEVYYKKKTVNVELKITAASAGSLVLKYTSSNPEHSRWHFDPHIEDKEKIFIRDVALKTGALKKINRDWNKVPKRRDGESGDYDYDHTTFAEISQAISPLFIAQYYAQKRTYYVNVGSHGFYLFNTMDPERLNNNLRRLRMPPVPSFTKAASAKYRARVQSKGGGNYQFTFEMGFSINAARASEYNIAPIDPRGNNVRIYTKNFSSPFV